MKIRQKKILKNVVKKDIFSAEEKGYFHFRIPVIVVTIKNTILAFCEARKKFGDWAPSSLVYRRSEDGGENWSEIKIIDDSDDFCINNPSVVVEKESNKIHILYCKNYSKVFYRTSMDDGKSFNNPVDITNSFLKLKRYINWNVVAIGPGGAIQITKGKYKNRIIFPCWLAFSGKKRHRPSVVSVVYSDNLGKNWQVGGIISMDIKKYGNMSETMLVELDNGAIMANSRTDHPMHRRLISYTFDGGETWTKPKFHPYLFEPICMAGLIRVPLLSNYENNKNKSILLYSNPNSYSRFNKKSRRRRKLSIKASFDDGKTWKFEKILEYKKAAYSCLASEHIDAFSNITANSNSYRGFKKNIYCLYERGGNKKKYLAYQYICFAKFKLKDLLN
ncbi:MAG: sialidase family protein [Promethearchaeota archaeon]